MVPAPLVALRLVLASVLTGGTLAVPARAEAPLVASGRVVIPTSATAPETNVDAGGATGGVALPDGGAVLVGPRGRASLVAVRLRADGSVDPTFGTGGIARPSGVPRLSAPQVLLQPDGAILIAGSGASIASMTTFPEVVVVRLTASGALDPAFGSGGIAKTGVQGSCGSCEPVSLAPDGGIVVAGNTGTLPSPPPTPGPITSLSGVVTRLTPAGQVDRSFGRAGLADIPRATGANAGGLGTAVTPDGRIVVLARGGDGMVLTAMTPSGAQDPSFHGGAPQVVPVDYAFTMLRHPEGPVDVLGPGRIVRYGTDGEVDPAFATSGVADVAGAGVFEPTSRMLAGADTSTLLVRPGSYEPHLSTDPGLVVRRVLRSGEAQAVASVRTGFGGGYASNARSTRLVLGGVGQDSFLPAVVLRRVTGGFLAVGGVRIIRYTGEGEGFSRGLIAAAAYDRTFAVDPSFGGARTTLRARVRPVRQRAERSAALRRVLVRLESSAPGLGLVRIRDGRGRVVAQVVAPLYAAGTPTVRVPLTATGRRLLARGGRRRLRVGWDVRDVLGARAGGATTVVLT